MSETEKFWCARCKAFRQSLCNKGEFCIACGDALDFTPQPAPAVEEASVTLPNICAEPVANQAENEQMEAKDQTGEARTVTLPVSGIGYASEEYRQSLYDRGIVLASPISTSKDDLPPLDDPSDSDVVLRAARWTERTFAIIDEASDDGIDITGESEANAGIECEWELMQRERQLLEALRKLQRLEELVIESARQYSELLDAHVKLEGEVVELKEAWSQRQQIQP